MGSTANAATRTVGKVERKMAGRTREVSWIVAIGNWMNSKEEKLGERAGWRSILELSWFRSLLVGAAHLKLENVWQRKDLAAQNSDVWQRKDLAENRPNRTDEC